MTTEQLQQCLEEAFGELEPPYFEGLGSFYSNEQFLKVVKTDTVSTRRWQELRPLTRYLHTSLDIFRLTPEACRYYLPAYLYAMTNWGVVWQYLTPVLDTLWYEDEWGDPLYKNPDRGRMWEELMELLTDRQKRCVAHCLVEILKRANDTSAEVPGEVEGETDRIEYMLNRHWNAWL